MPNHAMFLFGIPSHVFYTSADLFVETQLLLTEYYGFDFPYIFGDVHNIEAEALGMQVIYRTQAAPLLDPSAPLIQGRQDLERIQTPDCSRAGRMPFVLETYRLLSERTGIPALRWFCAPFSLACAVRGYPAWVRDMKRDAPFAHSLLDRLIEQVLLPWITCSIQHAPAARAATGFDAWATFPIINEPIFHQFIVPHTLRLRQHFAGENCEVGVTSGWGESLLPDPAPVLAQKIRLRGALRGLDPDVQLLGPGWYADLAFRHNLPLGLGLDARLIHDGPIEAIVERVKAYIQSAGRRGRLTIMINNVAGDTPSEHLHAVVAAVHTYGQYPLADKSESIPFEMPDVEPFADFARRQGWKLEQVA
jgi:uroporphyrinogen-III decarboxylase